MRALITGGYGFVGRHLAKHLEQCGDDIAVTYRPDQANVEEDPYAKILDSYLPLPKASQSLALDIRDKKAVEEVVSLLRPDVIYHLAAITFVPEAENDPNLVSDVNFSGTKHLFDAIRSFSPQTQMLCVSSAEVYGIPRPGSLPLTEKSELRPISEYGVTKAMADISAFKYSYRDNVKIIRVRSFPHVGPGQSDRFALSSFAKQVALAKLGKAAPEINVGNLEVKRDYTDVGDVVRAYREAILNGKQGEVYNICSGKSIAIGDMLNLIIARAQVDVEIKQDPSRIRVVDIPDSYGSYDKAQRDFGWAPRVEQEAMIDGLLTYWLDVLA